MAEKEDPEELECLLNGLKPKTGAQWGRGGNGFLDRAGYWLLNLPESNSSEENAIVAKSIKKIKELPDLKERLLKAKTFNEAGEVFSSGGFPVPASDLLLYQAEKILHLSAESAEAVASES